MKNITRTSLFSFFLLLFCFTSVSAQECDCPGDYDYNGVINPNEVVDVLVNFSCEPVADYCNDLNGDGNFNMYDLLTYLDRLGYYCDAEVPEQTQSSFAGLHLVEWTDYPDTLIGNIDGLPVGTKVYRLYASIENAEEHLVAMYGTENSPMVMNHSASLYSWQTSNPITPSQNTALLVQFIPELQLRSYLGLGYTDFGIPATGSEIYLAESQCAGENQFDDFFGSENTSLISNSEACIFRLETNENNISEEELSTYRFLGQFTTTGSIDGVINLASRYMVSDYQPEPSHLHEGLSFSSDNLDVFGCMDIAAFNYNPEATLDIDCLYAEPGDLNGDGNFNSGDLTILLADFGCTNDCGVADINGDGLVNSADLIALLGLL